MSKTDWLAHILEVTGSLKKTPEYMAHVQSDCKACNARRRTKRANQNRKLREDTMRDLGLTKTPYGWE